MSAPTPSLSSFYTPDSKLIVPPRLAISLEALDKRGKTHWAINTSPEPICILSNDTGTVEVYKKAKVRGRRVSLIEQHVNKPDPKVIKRADVDAAEMAAWKKEWARFEDIVDAVIADKTIRTFIVDQATDLANLCELAHFGKLRGNARMDIRAEYNASFTRWFWALYKQRPDLNIILIHKLKKEYKPNSKGQSDWTGKYECGGFTGIGFMVDMSVRCDWDSVMKDFYTELDSSKPTRYESATELIGQRWYAKKGESGFGQLGLSVFPETEMEPEVWGL